MATETPAKAHKAGAFDIRLIIALLLGVYGIVLTVMGIGFTTQADLDKAAGVRINLWAGLGMLVIGLLFVLWARVRPLLVPVEEPTEEPSADGPAAETE